MDPNTVIVDISSDEEEEETTGRNHNHNSDIDDPKWLTDLLDEVTSDDDDDCVVLESDPNEAVSESKDAMNGGKDKDEEDEIVVVGEKGQVACRDYPHSRHLCINFPFATTPNQNHCEQCYCYVCDSLAPCVYWGNGSAGTDHCHATDKDDLWKLARQNTIKGSKGVQPVHKAAHASLSNRQHPRVVHRPTPPLVQRHSQIPRPGSIHAVQRSANFQHRNTVNENRLLSSMRKLHPDLVSQMSARKNTARVRNNQMHNLGTQNNRLFKKVSSLGVATTAIRNTISSYRGNFGNGSGRQNYHVSGMISGSDQYSGSSLQPNAVNTSVPYHSHSQQYRRPTVNNPPLPPQPQFTNHLNPNVQSQVNSNPSPQSQQYRPPTVNNPPLPPQPRYTNPNVQSQANSNLSPQSQQYRHPTVNNPPLPPQPQYTNHLSPNVQSQVSSNPFPSNLQYPVSHLVPPSTSQPQMASSQPSYTVPAQSSYSAPSETQLNSLLVNVSEHTQNLSLGNEAQSVVKDFLKDYGLDLPSSQDSGTVEGAGPVNESTVPRNLADYQYDWIFENLPVGPGLDSNGTYGLTDLSYDTSFIDTELETYAIEYTVYAHHMSMRRPYIMMRSMLSNLITMRQWNMGN
nr:hypothetical protein [Tanacetum cinerariifolium]